VGLPLISRVLQSIFFPMDPEELIQHDRQGQLKGGGGEEFFSVNKSIIKIISV